MNKIAYQQGQLLALQQAGLIKTAIDPLVADMLLRSGIGGTTWGLYDAMTSPEDRLRGGLVGMASGMGAGAASTLAGSGLKKLLGQKAEKTLGGKVVAGLGQSAAGIGGGVAGKKVVEKVVGEEKPGEKKKSGRHAVDTSD